MRWLGEAGEVPLEDFARTFNGGLGMIAVVAADDAGATSRALEAEGATVYRAGVIEAAAPGAGKIIIDNMAQAWRG